MFKNRMNHLQPHIIPSILDAIGNTPLVELSRLTKNLEGRILAKLDYLNPGASKKDRIAVQMIEDAERNGELTAGQTVVELTSGNTGTGLAIVCKIKGYPFVAVMSKGNSIERAQMMTALGAEVILVEQSRNSTPGQVSGDDLDLVEKKAQKVTEQRAAFRADQFTLDGNFRAHYLHTGPEIIHQTRGEFDAYCEFVGTGGTFAGCAAAFKEHKALIKNFIIEPATSAVLAGKEVGNPSHRIQGGGYSRREIRYLNPEYIDGYIAVSDDEAIRMTRKLAETEGIFAGFSSGANIAGAVQLLEGELKGKTMVTTINDSGLKYLSTDLWL
jgi:cysteine synthase A